MYTFQNNVRINGLFTKCIKLKIADILMYVHCSSSCSIFFLIDKNATDFMSIKPKMN